MNPWSGLIKKEFRQMRLVFLLLLGLEIVFFAGSFYISSREVKVFGENVGATVLATYTVLIIGLHVFYLLGYMLASLQQEGKRMNLWLHNPQSGRTLLLAKLLIGLLMLLVSLIVCYLGLLFPFQSVLQSMQAIVTRGEIAELGGLALLHVAIIAVYLAIWAMFLWTLYQVFASRIGKFSIFAIIVFVILVLNGFDLIQQTHLYTLATQWGKLSHLPTSFELNADPENFNMQTGHLVPLYVGNYVFHFAVILMLFFLSSWLVDKKVEV